MSSSRFRTLSNTGDRLSPNTRFRPSAGVVSLSRDQTTVLLDMAVGVYYTLNEVGGRVWDMLIAGHEPAEIISKLQMEYDVAADTLSIEIAGLIRQLQAARLLVAE